MTNIIHLEAEGLTLKAGEDAMAGIMSDAEKRRMGEVAEQQRARIEIERAEQAALRRTDLFMDIAELEEEFMRMVDSMDVPGNDGRALALARTSIQTAVHWLQYAAFPRPRIRGPLRDGD